MEHCASRSGSCVSTRYCQYKSCIKYRSVHLVLLRLRCQRSQPPSSSHNTYYQPNNMKEALVTTGPKVNIVDTPIPKAGADQVVIKVVYSGSNPKDWKVPGKYLVRCISGRSKKLTRPQAGSPITTTPTRATISLASSTRSVTMSSNSGKVTALRLSTRC
jgi:hypothetical protein